MSSNFKGLFILYFLKSNFSKVKLSKKKIHLVYEYYNKHKLKSSQENQYTYIYMSQKSYKETSSGRTKF